MGTTNHIKRHKAFTGFIQIQHKVPQAARILALKPPLTIYFVGEKIVMGKLEIQVISTNIRLFMSFHQSQQSLPARLTLAYPPQAIGFTAGGQTQMDNWAMEVIPAKIVPRFFHLYPIFDKWLRAAGIPAH